MNRTKAIVVIAALLSLAAILLARTGSTVTPDPTPVAGKGNVAIGAAPSDRYVLVGGGGEVFLDISLAGLARLKPRQLPINLALVIDRSGSMAGQKLEHAREAARAVVSRLREGDRIAIVTYGSDVTVLVPSTLISESTRASVLASIDTIVDRGGTFLSGGLESGRDEVLRHGRGGHVNRVVLISDGQANEGVTGTAELAAMARQAALQGVHVTTMGVGLDFNENLMTALAEHGGGHYYFIESSGAMASIFSKELETMLATVARTASLRLTLEPGVELLDLYGYTFERNGREVRLDLPDLYSGQSRKLIARLRAPADREGKVALARVELAYVDVASGAREVVETAASVVLTRDAQQVLDGKDRGVLARAEQAAAAKNLSEAMEAYGRGDVARSQAVLRAQIDATVRANKAIQSKDLETMVGTMKARLSGTATAAPSSEEGKALIKRGKYEAYQLSK